MISFPVIVPVKAFDLAKQRLSGILQPPERAALARTMLRDVLNVVASAVLPSNVIVITSSPEASAIAKSAGTLVLQEATSSDLNSAIEAATRHVMVQNAGGFLMLPADVPEITIAVLHQALVALNQNGSVVLAPAIGDGGTNLLACRPPHAIRPEFGAGSFAKHLAAAKRSGLACHVLNSPELGGDIDSPEDLARFLDRRTSTLTDRLLRDLGRDLGVATRRVPPGLATAYETQLLSGGNLSEERREYLR
jgi:2-phospho-L-lactate/phosphoenolpyruvate guanylyltransferase